MVKNRRTVLMRIIAILLLVPLVGLFVLTPALATSSSSSIAFNPVVDAYVSSSYPTANYGAGTTLRVDGSPDVHSYVRFTLSGLNGAAITGAQLQIYANSGSSSGLTAWTVADNTWGETSITYNNAPPLGTSLNTSTAVATGTWVTMDVSAYVKAEGTYSFGVTTPGGTAISLASRESGANAPKLVLTLNSGSTPAATATRAATATPTRTPAACATSTPSTGTYSVTLCFTSPADAASLTGDAAVAASVSLSGAAPTVQRMVFYVDGTYVLTDYQSPYTFQLPTSRWVDGSHTLAVEASMHDGFTTQQATLSVGFSNGVNSPPVNNNHFQPTSGRAAPAGSAFIVAAVGDGASGEANAGKVTDLLTSINPNLLLYLGDVYEQGSATEFHNWYGTPSTFFDRLRSITDPTVGNHEYLTSGANGYFDYWDNIPKYYGFDAGGWHFFSLDANPTYTPTGVGSAQYQWLQQQLAALPAQSCTIVYYHQPLFNIGMQKPATYMSDIWQLMAQYGVDIVLNGHDHNYQRWVPLDGNGQPSPNGITEIVVGTGGHGLQSPTATDSRVAYSAGNAYGGLLLQLNSSSAEFSFHTTSGTIIDSGTIPCVSPALGTQTPTAPPTAAATATPTTAASPTPTLASGGSITVAPNADSYVNSSYPATNYGTATTLRVDGSPDVHSYVRFAVPGLNGQTISSAKLQIYANSASSSGLTAWTVADNSWSETSITYNSAPPLGTNLNTSAAVVSGTWITMDVSAYVKAEGTYSLGVTTPGGTAISLASRESGANAPKLVLTLDGSGSTATPTPAAAPGAIQHVFVILMENKSYNEVWNTSASPYITQLGNSYARATNYFAITHPSLPNYLDLFGGSNYSITTDCEPSSACHISRGNLGDTLEAKGLTWKAYEESMPSPCYLTASGNYAPKHNPPVYFDDIRTNTTRCNSHDVAYTSLAADLASASSTPNFSFLTPDLCDDMHNCSISTGDTWLSNNVPPILNSPACTVDKCLVVLTWDEDDSTQGNQVLTIFAGSAAKTGGVVSAVSYNHFSLLRTIEYIFGLPTLTSNDAAASPMTDLLR